MLEGVLRYFPDIDKLLDLLIITDSVDKRRELASRLKSRISTLENQVEIHQQKYIKYLEKFNKLSEFIMKKEGLDYDPRQIEND